MNAGFSDFPAERAYAALMTSVRGLFARWRSLQGSGTADPPIRDDSRFTGSSGQRSGRPDPS